MQLKEPWPYKLQQLLIYSYSFPGS